MSYKEFCMDKNNKLYTGIVGQNDCYCCDNYEECNLIRWISLNLKGFQFIIKEHAIKQKQQESNQKREEMTKQYYDLKNYFYYEKCNLIDIESSIVLRDKVARGLAGILDEIFEYADDCDFDELKARLDFSCSEYNFPANLIN